MFVIIVMMIQQVTLVQNFCLNKELISELFHRVTTGNCNDDFSVKGNAVPRVSRIRRSSEMSDPVRSETTGRKLLYRAR